MCPFSKCYAAMQLLDKALDEQFSSHICSQTSLTKQVKSRVQVCNRPNQSVMVGKSLIEDLVSAFTSKQLCFEPSLMWL